MKTKLTAEQLEEITRIQEKDGITRKSAIRKYQRQAKAAAQVKTKKQRTKVAKAAPEKLTPEEAGKARSEGLALYKIAGRPRKQDFVKVFGKDGVRWTWEQRAKAVGLANAREAAKQFPTMLAAKAHKSAAVVQ